MEKATLVIRTGKASHNDRSCAGSDKNVRDKEKTKDNLVAIRVNNKFSEAPIGRGYVETYEKKFYAEMFSKSLERKNTHYRSKGNKKAIKTIDEYYHSHPPKEMILQIGKGFSHTKNELGEAVIDLVNKLQQNPGLAVLNFVIHMDEEACHCHLRYVMCHETDKGDVEVNYNAQLNKIGYKADSEFDEAKYKQEHPEATKKQICEAKAIHNRYHNAQIDFTDKVRKNWYAILKGKGYQIDEKTNPKNKSFRNLRTQEYNLEKTLKELASAKRESESIMLQNAYDSADRMKDFLESKGLWKEYLNSSKSGIDRDDGVWTEEEAREAEK